MNSKGGNTYRLDSGILGEIRMFEEFQTVLMAQLFLVTFFFGSSLFQTLVTSVSILEDICCRKEGKEGRHYQVQVYIVPVLWLAMRDRHNTRPWPVTDRRIGDVVKKPSTIHSNQVFHIASSNKISYAWKTYAIVHSMMQLCLLRVR